MPVSQHQKTAPGPPRATAVETPMILPVPRVAARVVARAPKAERFLEGLDALCLSGVMERRRALPICRCGMWSFKVKKRWVPISRNKSGRFQRKSLIKDNIFKAGHLSYCFGSSQSWKP